MGEARRRKLAGLPTRPPAARSRWADPKDRASLLGMIHEALAQDLDPTVSGATVLLPGREPVFISAAEPR
jgi:hypothetical protein